MSWPFLRPDISWQLPQRHGELRNASKRMFGCRVGFSWAVHLGIWERPRRAEMIPMIRGVQIGQWIRIQSKCFFCVATVVLSTWIKKIITVNILDYHTGCISRVSNRWHMVNLESLFSAVINSSERNPGVVLDQTILGHLYAYSFWIYVVLGGWD